MLETCDFSDFHDANSAFFRAPDTPNRARAAKSGPCSRALHEGIEGSCTLHRPPPLGGSTPCPLPPHSPPLTKRARPLTVEMVELLETALFEKAPNEQLHITPCAYG